MIEDGKITKERPKAKSKSAVDEEITARHKGRASRQSADRSLTSLRNLQTHSSHEIYIKIAELFC